MLAKFYVLGSVLAFELGAVMPAPSATLSNPAAYTEVARVPNPPNVFSNFPRYMVPKPPSPQGQFRVITIQPNSTTTILAIIDSLSDYNGATKIKHNE